MAVCWLADRRLLEELEASACLVLLFFEWEVVYCVVVSGPPLYSGCVLGSEINYAFSSWVSRPHMNKQEPGLNLLEGATISQTASPSRSLP